MQKSNYWKIFSFVMYISCIMIRLKIKVLIYCVNNKEVISVLIIICRKAAQSRDHMTVNSGICNTDIEISSCFLIRFCAIIPFILYVFNEYSIPLRLNTNWHKNHQACPFPGHLFSMWLWGWVILLSFCQRKALKTLKVSGILRTDWCLKK